MKAPAAADPQIDPQIIDAKVRENIVDKIAGGGVPTAREERILKSAADHEERGQGRPSKTVRWTCEHAATEFGLDRRTLAKRIHEKSIEAGSDGKFSTRDICHAVFGDDPRVEKDREQAKNFRLKNEELQRERIPHDVIDAVDNETFQAIAAALKNAKGKVLTAERINEIFAAFRGMPAAREKRLRKRG